MTTRHLQILAGLVVAALACVAAAVAMTRSPAADAHVDTPVPGEALLGTSWSVHGGTLEIGPDGSAVAKAHGVCPAQRSVDWCNDVVELNGVATGSGLTLTVTKSYVANQTTGATYSPDPKYGIPVGTVFTAELYHEVYLVTERFSPDGERVGSPESANGLGNPYLCLPGGEDPERLCGA